MLNKCCILACVTSQTTAVGRLSKNRGLPMASRGQKRTITGQLHRFPRRALRNALALGSTRGRPNPTAIWVPSVARRACQTALRRKCRMFPKLAKPQRNAGGAMIHAGSTKQCCDAGAAESNITRQRVLALKTHCNSCRSNYYQIALQSVSKCFPRQILKH